MLAKLLKDYMKLELDGKFTKMLKAYAQLFGLEHCIECYATAFGLRICITLFARTKWYDSIVDVFEEGKTAYVSSLFQSKLCAESSIRDLAVEIEMLSKSILLDAIGERRYLKSMKGGGVMLGTGEVVPKFEVHNLPKSLEELEIKLDLAGISCRKCEVKFKLMY